METMHPDDVDIDAEDEELSDLQRSKQRWERGDRAPPEPIPPMEWQKKAFILIVAVLAYLWIPIYIQQFGALEDVYNHEPGICEFVEGLDDGSEDMETLPNGLTFISSGLEKMYNRTYTTNGAIYLFDMKNPTKKPISLHIEGDFDFQDFTPHGLSVYENPSTGKISVFVVNHDPDGDKIERFTFHAHNYTLVHSATFYDSRLTTANDVEAVSEDSFYFTNYLYTTTSLFKLAELYMPMTWGSIFYWQEGSRPQLVVNKLKQPNGITLSADQKLLYLAHEGEQEMHVYRRTNDNKLHLANVVLVNTSVDNMHLSPDGKSLWVGSHAVFWKIYKQLGDPDYPAPSQVLKLSIPDGIHVTKVTEVYANDGSQLHGSSVASYYEKKLLIGTVMHRTLLCDLTKKSADDQ